jgi:hypothetical protein
MTEKQIADLRQRAAVMVEFCRLWETDPDGRGVRWRLMYANNGEWCEITTLPAFVECAYRIEVRDPPREPKSLWFDGSIWDTAQTVTMYVTPKPHWTDPREYREIVPPAEWRPWVPTEQTPCDHHFQVKASTGVERAATELNGTVGLTLRCLKCNKMWTTDVIVACPELWDQKSQHSDGSCRILSEGDKCDCTLCRQSKWIKQFRTERDAANAEVERLRTKNARQGKDLDIAIAECETMRQRNRDLASYIERGGSTELRRLCNEMADQFHRGARPVYITPILKHIGRNKK